MNTYEVTSFVSGRVVEVSARHLRSAVKKAHRVITGKSGKSVTWHGVHAEVDGCGRYSRPVLTWTANK